MSCEARRASAPRPLFAAACPAADAACTKTTAFDPKVPTQRKVVGFSPGQRPATDAEVQRYLAAVDAASNRVKTVRVGTSAGGRPITAAFVSLPAQLAQSRLDALSAGLQKLRSGKPTEAQAKKFAASQAGRGVDRGRRPRQRAERRGRVAAAALRPRGAHGLRQREAAQEPRDGAAARAEPRRPRGRPAGELRGLRPQPRLVRADPARADRQGRAAARSSRPCCTSTRTRRARRASSSRPTRTRSITRSRLARSTRSPTSSPRPAQGVR